jgi:hypothetical protein
MDGVEEYLVLFMNLTIQYCNCPKVELRFLGIILRVLRLEVSVYNVHNTNQFQITFAQDGGWGRR